MQFYAYKPTKHILLQYKVRKNIPLPQHINKNIHIVYSHKQCVHIPDHEEPPKNMSVEETHLHKTTTSRKT